MILGDTLLPYLLAGGRKSSRKRSRLGASWGVLLSLLAVRVGYSRPPKHEPCYMIFLNPLEIIDRSIASS